MKHSTPISTSPACKEDRCDVADHTPWDDRVSLLHTRLTTVRKKKSFEALSLDALSEDINLEGVVMSDALGGGLKPAGFELPDMEGKRVTLEDMAGGTQQMWKITAIPDLVGPQAHILRVLPLIVKKVFADGASSGNEYEGLKRMRQAGILIPEATKIKAADHDTQYYAMANLRESHGNGLHKLDNLLAKVDDYYQFGFDLGTIHLVDIATGNGDRLLNMKFQNVFITDTTPDDKWRLVGLDSGMYVNAENFMQVEKFMLDLWHHIKEVGAEVYAQDMLDAITTKTPHADVKRGFADAIMAQPKRSTEEGVGLSLDKVMSIRVACLNYLGQTVQEKPAACRKKRAQEVRVESRDSCAETSDLESCVQTIAARIWREMMPIAVWTADENQPGDPHCEDDMTFEQIMAMMNGMPEPIV